LIRLETLALVRLGCYPTGCARHLVGQLPRENQGRTAHFSETPRSRDEINCKAPQPMTPSPDPSYPKLPHLDGLNLSRALMLESIAGLPKGDKRLPMIIFIWGCCRCEPVCDGTCFPSEMCSYFASNADHHVCRLSDGRGQVALVSGNSVSQLAHGNSCGCRTATQVWFGIAVATVLTDSPFGTPRESFHAVPDEAPNSARSHTWCDSDTGSRRQVDNMPYLGIGSISGIIHIVARLPHAARAVAVVAVLIAISH
jgi:hypothetical protein